MTIIQELREYCDRRAMGAFGRAASLAERGRHEASNEAERDGMRWLTRRDNLFVDAQDRDRLLDELTS